jgi:hypothetical protein
MACFDGKHMPSIAAGCTPVPDHHDAGPILTGRDPAALRALISALRSQGNVLLARIFHEQQVGGLVPKRVLIGI